MKIYIWADQEGTAGVFSRRENYLSAREYATMNRKGTPRRSGPDYERRRHNP